MKRIYRYFFALWLGLVLTIIFPFAANAKDTQILTYSVYAGGIHAVNATLKIETTPTTYTVNLISATQGFLKSLAPWSGTFSTTGIQSSDKKLFPTKHISESVWKSESEQKVYTYDGKGHFVSYKVVEKGADKTPKETPSELTKGTTDLLSSTLSLMQKLATTKTCSGNDLIFDGDRSYRLVFAETKAETLAKSDYNAYSGPAIMCTVEVKPEKGKWRKKPRGWMSIQEQGRQKGSLPTIWFAQAGGKPNSPYVPVKIRVKTNYGTLFMHMTSYKTNPIKPLLPRR